MQVVQLSLVQPGHDLGPEPAAFEQPVDARTVGTGEPLRQRRRPLRMAQRERLHEAREVGVGPARIADPRFKLPKTYLVQVEGDPQEFAASNGLSLNVLPTSPHQVIAVAGFPRTAAAMQAAGCTVTTFEADALCIACEGGPTCLTRPILRG